MYFNLAARIALVLFFRVTNLYNMLPVRTAGQLEVLLLVIRYAKEAKLVAMLASFFAGVDDWIKVSFSGDAVSRILPFFSLSGGSRDNATAGKYSSRWCGGGGGTDDGFRVPSAVAMLRKHTVYTLRVPNACLSLASDHERGCYEVHVDGASVPSTSFVCPGTAGTANFHFLHPHVYARSTVYYVSFAERRLCMCAPSADSGLYGMQGWELSVADQRRLHLLISDTLGSEGKAVESQKVSLHRLFTLLEIYIYKRTINGSLSASNCRQ